MKATGWCSGMRSVVSIMLTALTVSLGLVACAIAYEESDMQKAASATTKIAAKLDAYVFGNPAAASKMSEAELLEAIRAQDANLLSELEAYTIRVRVIGENSSVLVCDKAEPRALIEDAGCSAISDRQWWQPGQQRPCEFELDLRATCSVQ